MTTTAAIPVSTTADQASPQIDDHLHECWMDNLTVDVQPVTDERAQAASILPATTPDAIHFSVQGFRQAAHYKYFWLNPAEANFIDMCECIVCGHTMIPASTMTTRRGLQTLTLGLCLQCGMFQHIRRPARAWYADYYRQTWDPDARDATQWPQKIALRRGQVDNTNGYLRAGARVLEVGCGWGSAIAAFKRLGYECCAVEATAHRSAFIRERVGIPCLTGEIEGLPLGTDFLQPASFDLVFSTNVFEHVYNTRECMERVHQLVRADGYAYIEIPNYYQENLLLNTHGVSHTGNFSRANFLYLAQTIGFDLVRDCSDPGNIRMLLRKAPPLTAEQRQATLDWMSGLLPYRGLAYLLEKNGCAHIPADATTDQQIDLQWFFWPKAETTEPFLHFQYYFLRQWVPTLNALRTAIVKRKPLELVQHLLPIQYVYNSDQVPIWYY